VGQRRPLQRDPHLGVELAPRQTGEVLAGTDSGIHRLDVASHVFQHVPSPMDAMQVWSIARSPSDSNLILAARVPVRCFVRPTAANSGTRSMPVFPDTACM